MLNNVWKKNLNFKMFYFVLPFFYLFSQYDMTDCRYNGNDLCHIQTPTKIYNAKADTIYHTLANNLETLREQKI